APQLPPPLHPAQAPLAPLHAGRRLSWSRAGADRVGGRARRPHAYSLGPVCYPVPLAVPALSGHWLVVPGGLRTRRHADDPRGGRERQGDLRLDPADGPGPGGGDLPPHPDGDGRHDLSVRGVAAWDWALSRRRSVRLRPVGGGGQAPPPRHDHLSPAAVPMPRTVPHGPGGRVAALTRRK